MSDPFFTNAEQVGILMFIAGMVVYHIFFRK